MSEADRSRLYDWLCEQTDEPLAEYVMSCLSTVPLPQLATKADVGVLKADIDVLRADVGVLKADIDVLRADVGVLKADIDVLRADVGVLKADVGVLRADIDKLDGKIDSLVAQREADRDQYIAQREADRDQYFAQREADRDEYLAHCEADRKAHQADFAVLAKRISRLTFWLPFEVLGALAAVVAVTEWLRG